MLRNRSKTLRNLTLAAVALVALTAARTASAHGHGGKYVVASGPTATVAVPATTYYTGMAAAPATYAAAPVAYAPATVTYAQAPATYAAAPVIYAPVRPTYAAAPVMAAPAAYVVPTTYYQAAPVVLVGRRRW